MVTPTQLKRYRKQAGKTREELAVEIGVSSQTIWRWEHGDVRIPVPEQKLLERIINGTKESA